MGNWLWLYLISIVILALLLGFYLYNKMPSKDDAPWIIVITAAINLINQSFESPTNYFQLVVGCLLIVIGIGMYYVTVTNVYVLNLFGPSKKRIREKENRTKLLLLKDSIIEREIDIIRIWNGGLGLTKEKMAYIDEELKEKVAIFAVESSNEKRALTGEAPIPLTILAGTYSKNANFNLYFEYSQEKSKYTSLGKRKRKNPIEKTNFSDRTLEVANFLHEKELLVTVETTFPIMDIDLEQFIDVPYHLEFRSKCIKRNAITSKDQLFRALNTIFEELSAVTKKYSIKRVHLVMATQSCLCFELGQILEANFNMIPEVISYHYVNKIEGKKYPIGIAITQERKGELILNEGGNQCIH